MSDTMFGYLLIWKDEIDNTLKDKYINDYTRWKYEKYKLLCQFLLDEFSL